VPESWGNRDRARDRVCEKTVRVLVFVGDRGEIVFVSVFVLVGEKGNEKRRGAGRF
jgi:hypothetical protein